jgi:CRISPR-associated protein Cas2
MLVYDVDEKRVGRMLKMMRKHLHWIQNSVFEGELTDAQLFKLRAEILHLIDIDTDSVIIFKARDRKWLEKSVIGKEKRDTGNLL